MAWTETEKLEFLCRLPWTIVPDVTPEGEHLLRVKELTGAVGSGETPEALEADFWESLRATLAAYLHFGDDPPLPSIVRALPWKVSGRQAGTPVSTAAVGKVETVVPLAAAAAA